MTVNASQMGENDLYRIIPQYNKYTPKYIYMTLDQRNEVTIKSVLRQLGFKPNQYNFRYHCTILYNEDDTSPLKEYTVELMKPINEVQITDVGVLGDYIVLFINSTDVEIIRRELEDMGYHSKHDGFIPHISILKDTVDSIDVNLVRDNLNRLKSANVRLMDLVYDNNNIKHYG